MALYFDKVKMLTYQHTPQFFEGGLRYKIQKNFSIEGVLYEPSAGDGVRQTWSKVDTLQVDAQDYQDLYLNGVLFAQKARVTSVNFEPGNEVKEQRYVFNIVGYSEGNLYNGQNNEFEGIDWESIAVECVERLDESFSYSLNSGNDASYDHSVNVKFNRDISNIGVDPIVLAKTLASALMSHCNLVGFIGAYGSYSDNGAGCAVRKLHTEVYNKIDFSCSFIEHAEIPNEEFCNYSFNYTHNLQINEKGITTVVEHGQIKGLANPVSLNAWNGYIAQTQIADVLTRVNGVYNAYISSGLGLKQYIITKAVIQDQFSGTVEYNYTFSDDPHLQNLAVWDYTITINRSVEGYIDITESGSVKGIGRPLDPAKMGNATNFYTTSVLPSLYARLLDAYLSFGGIHSSSLILIRRGESKAPYLGEITYSQVYTDNPQVQSNAAFRKQDIEVVTDYPTHLTVQFNVFNVKQIIQPQNTSTLGKRNITIKLKGARTTTMDEYLAFAKNLITSNGYNNIGTDTYIASAKYNLSPNTNDFSLAVGLTFHGFYKAFDSLTLT